MAISITASTSSRWMNRRRLLKWLVVASFVLAALIAGLLPANRRWIANPTGQPAVVGARAIEVRGDWFQNHVYAPAVVQVPVGTTLRWTFNDRGPNGNGELAQHNVVGQGWASPVLASGSYEHTFRAPGIYRYTCTLHKGMDGLVVVTE